MCNYKYRRGSSKKCQLYYSGTAINSELPLDENGLCFFHSQKVLFKVQHDFNDILVRTIDWLDQHCQQKEYNFREIRVGAGVQEIVIDRLMLKKDIHFGDSIFFSQLKLEHLSIAYRLIFDTCEFSDSVNFKGCNMVYIDFSYAKFESFLTMDELIMKSGNFILIRAQLKQGLIIRNAETRSNFSYFESDFGGGVVMEDSTFNGQVDFESVRIGKQFIISKCTFNANVEFIDTDFDITSNGINDRFKPIDFHQIKISRGAVLNFRGKEPYAMFKAEMSIYFLNDICEGKLHFTNANLYYLKPESKEKLLSLATEGKVIIGHGCIKYRIQTPLITIKTNAINENIMIELAHSFVNYFITSSGYSLGVEFVSKQIDAIKVFYFTDEDISLEEFYKRLQIAEEGYWSFSVTESPHGSKNEIANQIDNYVSKASIFSKVKLRQDYGLWFERDTKEMLRAISFNTSLPDSKIVNLYINKLKLSSDIKLKGPKFYGGSHQIADKIINTNQSFSNTEATLLNSIREYASTTENAKVLLEHYHKLKQQELDKQDIKSSKLVLETFIRANIPALDANFKALKAELLEFIENL